MKTRISIVIVMWIISSITIYSKVSADGIGWFITASIMLLMAFAYIMFMPKK